MLWWMLALAWDGGLDGRQWIVQPPPVAEPLDMAQEPEPQAPPPGVAVIRGEPFLLCCPFVDRSWFDELVKNRTGQLRHCYERARLLDRDLQTELVLHADLAADGTNTLVLRGEGPSSLKECILDAFDDADFPDQQGQLVVRYPIRLHPS